MIKRSLLIGSESKEVTSGEFSSNYFIIASGDFVIPLFWFTLFDEKDFFYYKYISKNGNELKLPRLAINFETGFERLCKRQKLFAKLIPPKLFYLYDKWAFLIQDLDTSYIHIDVSGLVENINELKEIDLYIRQILKIIDDVTGSEAKNIIKDFIGIEIKKTILSRKITFPEDINDITALLCGSSWLNDKPWESYF
jgi:hypothetical protein